MKVCKVCEEERPTDSFGLVRNKGKVTGRRGTCNVCRCTASKKKRKENPELYRQRDKEYRHKHKDKHKERQRTRHKLRKYGITQQEADELLESQGGVCAICGTDDPKPYWAVDHNHATGEVRGILCGNCNSAIGLLKDDPSVMDSAASYIRERGGYYNR